MAKFSRVGHTEAEGDDIQVGKHRGNTSGDEQLLGDLFLPQAHIQGYWNCWVRKDGWHVIWSNSLEQT